MAANVSGEYRVFKYYEGLCSAEDFPKEIAKVLSLGVTSKVLKDDDGNILKDSEILLSRNWDIVYPLPDVNINYTTVNALGKEEMFTLSFDVVNGIPDIDFRNDPTRKLDVNEYKAKILNQVDKINDVVILRTTTTPKALTEDNIDDLTVDPTTNDESLTMYLEIYRPTYLANPEEFPLDCERQGVIPYVATKEIHEDSLRIIESQEDAIYQDSTICEVTHPISTSAGEVDNVDMESAQKLVEKIINVTGNTTFRLPITLGSSTEIDLSQYLAKIRKEDAELYNFITSNLNANSGMEAREYVTLSTLTMSIRMEGADSFRFQLMATKALTIYEIQKDSEFTASCREIKTWYTPIDDLVPEYYLNGVYIPLDPRYYEVLNNNSTIRFKKDLTFEATENGVLVLRYKYRKDDPDGVVTQKQTILNNHYVLMRLFDHIDTSDYSKPIANVTNSAGEITKINSHVSPWAKLSWYRDFEEIFVDDIDSDTSVSAVSDGTVLVPLETPGLTSDTKMRYWINTNNDRFSLIVMGNAGLDYRRERHLISACYCGRIDSFEGSINDTSGNFALFTSSSTDPCNTELHIEKIYADMPRDIFKQSEADTILEADNAAKLKKIRQMISDAFATNVANMIPMNGSLSYTFKMADTETINMYYNDKEWPRFMVVTKDNDENLIPVTGIVPVDSREFFGDEGKMDSVVITLTKTKSSLDNQQWIDLYTSWTEANEYYLVLFYGAYSERNNITSGVTRDIFGNVSKVEKEDDYGLNSSDGVTSIMMYHTRSKAYYQKHHMLFATTEEYMSKVLYGKSSYTGEYYADRIKVTHGNDGPRGTLSDLLVIDSASLVAMDELVINKDFKRDPTEYEETFVYFPITAPFSPLSDGPNARYGLAIKKEEREPDYEDVTKVLRIGLSEIDTLAYNWLNVTTDIYPAAETRNGCDVYWWVLDGSTITNRNNEPVVLDKTQWMLIDGNKEERDYSPVKLAIKAISRFTDGESSTTAGDPGDFLENGNSIVEAGGTTSNLYIDSLAPGLESTDENKTVSTIKLKLNNMVSGGSGNVYLYGISDVPIVDKNSTYSHFREKSVIQVMLRDAANDSLDQFIYGVSNVPLKGTLKQKSTSGGVTTIADATVADLGSGQCDNLVIEDASPDKYLIIYEVEDWSDEEGGAVKASTTIAVRKILSVASVRLTNYDPANYDPTDSSTTFKNQLLRYPCNLVVNPLSGSGKFYYEIPDASEPSGYRLEGGQSYLTLDVPYGESVKLHIFPSGTMQISQNADNNYEINIYDLTEVNNSNVMGTLVNPVAGTTVVTSNTNGEVDSADIDATGVATGAGYVYELKNITYDMRIAVRFRI